MLLNCGVGEDLRIPSTAKRSNQSILKNGLNIRRTNIESVLNTGRTNAEAEAAVLWPHDVKN